MGTVSQIMEITLQVSAKTPTDNILFFFFQMMYFVVEKKRFDISY